MSATRPFHSGASVPAAPDSHAPMTQTPESFRPAPLNAEAMAAAAPEPSVPPCLIETLRVEPGRQLPLLDGHLQRLQRSSAALGYPCHAENLVRERIAGAVAALDDDAWWRLRLLLAPDGNLSLETTLEDHVRAQLALGRRDYLEAGETGLEQISAERLQSFREIMER